MEYYMKVTEDVQSEELRNKQLFEITITQDCKFYQAVRNAGKILKQHQQVLVVGEGNAASKAVAIADKLKEQYGNVTEHIDVCETDYKDVWVPKSSDLGLENLEVTRAVPTTKITIVRTEQQQQEQQKSSRVSTNKQRKYKENGDRDNRKPRKHQTNYVNGKSPRRSSHHKENQHHENEP